MAVLIGSCLSSLSEVTATGTFSSDSVSSSVSDLLKSISMNSGVFGVFLDCFCIFFYYGLFSLSIGNPYIFFVVFLLFLLFSLPYFEAVFFGSDFDIF